MKRILIKEVSGLRTESLLGTVVDLYETSDECVKAFGEHSSDYDLSSSIAVGYIADPNDSFSPYVVVTTEDDYEEVADEEIEVKYVSPVVLISNLVKKKFKLEGEMNDFISLDAALNGELTALSAKIADNGAKILDTKRAIEDIEEYFDRVNAILISDEGENEGDNIPEPECPLETFLKENGVLDKFNAEVERYLLTGKTLFNEQRLTDVAKIFEEYKDEAISTSFSWLGSRDNYDYWEKLHRKFIKYCENLDN